MDNHYSDLLYLTAGMPQGSQLGPLTSLLLIDNLSTQCLTHKYVDDTTLTELLTRGSVVVVADVFPQFSLGTNLLQFVKEFKYLGHTITSVLSRHPRFGGEIGRIGGGG